MSGGVPHHGCCGSCTQVEAKERAEAEAQLKAQEAKAAREVQAEATAASSREAEAAIEALQQSIQGVQVCREPPSSLPLTPLV